MAEPLRILTVCTHNRTRSVIAAALLERSLRNAGTDAVVRSGGTEADGLPATDGAVRLLRDRGIDVSSHRSRRLDDRLVGGADLVVTAEAAHVVWIAGRWPDAFAKTFTLPEIVALGADEGSRGDRPIDAWTAAVARRRPPSSTYLDRGVIDEIDDPTGSARRVWVTSFDEIEGLTTRLAELLR